MATANRTVQNIVKAAATAGTEERVTHSKDPATDFGQVPMRGSVRNKVLGAAINALSDSQKEKLLALTGEDKQRFIAAVLSIAGCMHCSVKEHMAVIEELAAAQSVKDLGDVKAGSWPSVAKLDRLCTPAPVKAPKAPKAEKTTKAKKPAAKKSTKKAPPKRKAKKSEEVVEA